MTHNAPAGYEYTGELRAPTLGEHYLLPGTGALPARALLARSGGYTIPQHILRREAVDGYEFTGENRPPRSGEYYWNQHTKGPTRAQTSFRTTDREIMRPQRPDRPASPAVEAVLRALSGTGHSVTVYTGINVYDVRVSEAAANTCRLTRPDGHGMTVRYEDISSVVAQ